MGAHGSEHVPIPYYDVLGEKKYPTSTHRLTPTQRVQFAVLAGTLGLAIVGLAAIKGCEAWTADNATSQAQAIGDPRPLRGFAEIRYGDIRDEIVDFLKIPMQASEDSAWSKIKAEMQRGFYFYEPELLSEDTEVRSLESVKTRWYPFKTSETESGPTLNPDEPITGVVGLVTTLQVDTNGDIRRIDWAIRQAPKSQSGFRFTGISESVNGNTVALARITPYSSPAK